MHFIKIINNNIYKFLLRLLVLKTEKRYVKYFLAFHIRNLFLIV